GAGTQPRRSRRRVVRPGRRATSGSPPRFPGRSRPGSSLRCRALGVAEWHARSRRRRAEAGELAFGTTDSWLVWNLTGGPDGGVHVTDVTNASRTLLMDLRTLDWHPALLDAFGIPATMLPQIRSSSEVVGTVESSSLLREVPIAGIL